ncbi:MAG: hypothetical protein QM644_17195 [Mobilitalea sp.]
MKLYMVGAVASGKSTLARRLSETSNIPAYSLDEVVHISDKANPWGNRKRSVEERDELFQAIISQDKWIIEDTGRPCFEFALKAADKIVLLEISKWNRTYRIIKRWIKQRLGIEKCIYKPRFDMLKWMLKWSKDYDTGRDNLKERISGYKEKVVTIKNNQDMKEFIVRYLANSIISTDTKNTNESRLIWK